MYPSSTCLAFCSSGDTKFVTKLYPFPKKKNKKELNNFVHRLKLDDVCHYKVLNLFLHALLL